jgi:hypothetical protein
LLDGLNRLLAEEDEWMELTRNTRAARRLKRLRETLAQHVREVGRSGNLPLIVVTEKAIIEGDLERHANSPMMTSSLKTALAEIAAIEKHIRIVDDPTRYRAVNEAYSLPRSRRGDLPYDDAGRPCHTPE